MRKFFVFFAFTVLISFALFTSCSEENPTDPTSEDTNTQTNDSSSGSTRTNTDTSGKTAAPSMNPSSGSYTNSLTVTVTCTDSNATIYYTTDGSDPSIPKSTSKTAPLTFIKSIKIGKLLSKNTAGASIKYDSAITITNSRAIKAIAYENGKTKSDITSNYYEIVYDSTQTNTNDTNSTSTNTTNTENKYSVTYNKNGAESGSAPTDTNEYAKDETVRVLGNTGALSLSGCSFGGWNTKESGGGSAYASNATFSMGSSNVTLYAQWSDSEKPSVNISSPVNDTDVSNSITIKASASDNVSLTKVVFYINGSKKQEDTSSPYEYVWDTSGETDDATYAIKAIAYDGEGNSNVDNDTSVTVNNTFQWRIVGSSNINIDDTDKFKMTLDNQGIPFVIYKNKTTDEQGRVKKFNGTSWDLVEGSHFSAAALDDSYPSISIYAHNSTAYIAYKEVFSPGKASIKKSTGSGWEYLAGDDGSNMANLGKHTSVYYHEASDTVFLASTLMGDSSVWKFKNNTRTQLATNLDCGVGFVHAFDNGGTPKVYFVGSGPGSTFIVYAYNNSDYWEAEASLSGQYINASFYNNAIYVIYKLDDGGFDHRRFVSKWDGTSWTHLGCDPSSHTAIDNDVETDTTYTAYIVCNENGLYAAHKPNSGGFLLYKYNEANDSWDSISGITASQGDIAVYDGKIYHAFKESTGGKLNVEVGY